MPLTNSQYDSIMRNYDRRRAENHYKLQERIEALHEALPEIAQIDETIATLSLTQAERLLNGDTAALAELKSEMKRLAQRKQAILTESGYPADYLQEQYQHLYREAFQMPFVLLSHRAVL